MPFDSADKHGYSMIPYCVLYFLKMIFIFGYGIFHIMTIYHYYPLFYIIPITLHSVCNIIRAIIYYYRNPNSFSYKYTAMDIVSSIIDMFGILVLLEIVIVKLCGMNKNVEVEIINIQKKEHYSKADLLSENLEINNISFEDSLIQVD